MLIGFGGPLASFILRIIDAGDADSSKYLDIAVRMEWFLRISPSFCIGHGLFNVINISFFEVGTICSVLFTSLLYLTVRFVLELTNLNSILVNSCPAAVLADHEQQQ